jgi:1,5-anhydro-D-fructose reductase (1,5-anhydro-D-mannitol-forming)
MAAKAGKPCCVEKPMAMSYTEAQEMVSAFNAANLPLFVAYYRRSLPRFLHIKGWIDSGAIGRVRHVHWTLMRMPTQNEMFGKIGWRTSASEAPGGYFDDLACHGLDLFDFLIGLIDQAAGQNANQQSLYDVPDAVCGSWHHANGSTGTGVWNFAASARSDTVSIFGSHGKISFSIFEDEPIIFEVGSSTESIEVANPTPIQLHHVEAMIGHICGQSVHPSLGTNAMRTAWVMDQILGRTSVSV